MKSCDFGTALRALAALLETAGARPANQQVEAIAAVFEASTATIAAVVKRIDTLPAQSSGSPNVGDVARLLFPLRKLLEKIAKAGAVEDLKSVEALLLKRSSTDLDAFVRAAVDALGTPPKRKQAATALRDDLVGDYHRKLDANLGNEGAFPTVYDDLRANGAMGKSELAALAKRFAGATVRSKADALKKIWNRHQQLLVFQAKARATGGRSAA
jgi:hypothetical protein